MRGTSFYLNIPWTFRFFPVFTGMDDTTVSFIVIVVQIYEHICGEFLKVELLGQWHTD